MMKTRSFTELRNISSFVERYHYLRLTSTVGQPTFGFDRYLNQRFYTSVRWQRIRDIVIVRDNGRDLGIEGYEITGKILIHHMNPILPEDLEEERDVVFDPEFLICTTHKTHLAIHYGDDALLPVLPEVRKKGDTCPWTIHN